MTEVYSEAARGDVITNEFHKYQLTNARGNDDWIDLRTAEQASVIVHSSNGTGRATVSLSFSEDKPTSDGGDINIAPGNITTPTIYNLGGPNADYPLPIWMRPRITTSAGASNSVEILTHVRRMG